MSKQKSHGESDALPRHVDHLLIGGGAASVSAATTLRLEDSEASILIISAEAEMPFYRPALSKQLLLDATDDAPFLLHPESFYRDERIALRRATSVFKVCPEDRVITTDAGEAITYGQLLIASGALPRRLGIPGETLAGVHVIRHLGDCAAVRHAVASGAKRAVVVGGSFLGMEIAMSLLERGLHLTVIEQRPSILPHLEAPEISEFFYRHAVHGGANILLSDTLIACHGDERLCAVQTRSGQRLDCDLLIVSAGVMPATDFLAGSGIELDEEGWVLVDEQLRSNVAHVFAAGDVTRFFDPIFGRRRHIEHWDSALRQGRLAARNMLGQRRRHDEVSYFFCDVGNISFNVLGDPEDGQDRICRGSLDSGSFALFYLRDNVPRALFSLGRSSDETREAENLIRYRVNLAAYTKKLADPEFRLASIPMQDVLVLQGGGAMGAFECGVVKALEEARVFPDIVAGVSIGALNGAIIAAHPQHATEALEAFWAELAVTPPFGLQGDVGQLAAKAEILLCGVPKFFKPRSLSVFSEPLAWPMHWTSYYDTTPMRALISRYVDFPALKRSPVRLLVGAVNVRTASLEIFDSYVDDLTPEHLLASGSLPPGFPWTIVNGEAYWDGGMLSNSPLDFVIDRCGAEGKKVFVVDLFSQSRPLPSNMVEVMARRDEIVYAERMRGNQRRREQAIAYRRLVESILAQTDPVTQAKIRQRPLYIELMGDGADMHITRFVRQGQDGEPSSRDYDFSVAAIRSNLAAGYALARQTLHAESDNFSSV